MINEKTYEPNKFEMEIYKKWEEAGCFKADENSKKPPFCIIMPPPNVTSIAHIGHGLDMTIQDILTRYKRMQGYETLWQPGADHAAIATEVKLVEKLAKEGKTKESIGREAFDKEAWDWYNYYGDAIMKQFRRIGFSADWTRYRFTMDPKSVDAVLEAFVRLYNKGLIYRGTRLGNWCTTCRSAISDDEVEYFDEKSNMWHIRYPFADGSGYIVVATTRPETLFGDQAVAVNPTDTRYTKIVGKMLNLPLTNKQIPIIADEYVEKDFGTGMVKITPAHDPNDYEVGKRHNLEIISVITKDGKLNENAGKYVGLDARSAREKIVEELKSLNLIEKIEPYTHSVGHCERCHNAIEPLVTNQWYVAMKELSKPAIDCVKDGKLKIYPKRFEKNYFHWLENIQDWCISRQLWTGHRIPIYYCDDCGETFASKIKTNCPKCGSHNIHQDEDVLDTWFSSALWPFSTLGWPDKTKALEKFYPTSVLVTGYDILTHWVTKMVYMGIECAGQIPFKDTLIHGLVRDELGRKMSKSLGNGIDPIKVANDYGADALRIGLIKDLSLGMDTKVGESKFAVSKQFLNKVWNASKFVAMAVNGENLLPIENCELSLADKWILTKLNETTKTMCKNLDKYDVGLALNNIYTFFINDFCDWYIELCKPMLKTGNEVKQNVASVLYYTFLQTLKLMHPFIPFCTEYIYQSFKETGFIMQASYPEYNKKFVFKKEKDRLEQVIELVRNIRQARLEENIEANKGIILEIKKGTYVQDFIGLIGKLAGIEKVEECDLPTGKMIVSSLGEFYVKAEVDNEKRLQQIEEELKKVEFEIKRSEGMLANDKFVAKAPKDLVKLEREKLERNKLLKEKLLNKKQEVAK